MPGKGTVGTSLLGLPIAGEHKNQDSGLARMDKAAEPVSLCEGWVWEQCRLGKAAASMDMHKNHMRCGLSQVRL